MRLLALITLMFCSVQLKANQLIGTVSKLRGEVSILELGDREAKKLILGQKVNKEASILTLDKSFVQIHLLDNTQINLGPNSKIVLDLTALEKIGVIHLLKGMLRTEVVKESGLKDKLYIKTRTAALGIRGTDFQTNFNPENNITNLVTFRGKVAMVKTQSPNLKESLESKNIVMVESGKFATISENLKNPTEPVKISPVQYTRLKLNTEMSIIPIVTNDQFKVELQKTIKEYSEISNLEKDKNGQSANDKDFIANNFRPTAGGVVDLATGFYIPPTINQDNFNKDLGLFEFKNDKGEINEIGEYIAPNGIILDPKKGFIIDPKNQKIELIADLKNLNQDISNQIIKPVKPSEKELNNKSEDAYEKYYKKD